MNESELRGNFRQKKEKNAGILTDFKIFRRIYGENLPQGAEVDLFRGSLSKARFLGTGLCCFYGMRQEPTLSGVS